MLEFEVVDDLQMGRRKGNLRFTDLHEHTTLAVDVRRSFMMMGLIWWKRM